MSNTLKEKVTVKHSYSDLAFFGGTPLFTPPLCVGRPNLAPREEILTEIAQILDSHRLSNNGPQVQAFELELAEALQVKHCIAVSNATLGLQLLIRALGLQGEVIVPSFTFISTVHALYWLGLKPVFCDVSPQTHTLDPKAVQQLLSSQTAAILGVHLWGQACAIEELEALAQAQGIPLLFDAAHALLCRSNKYPIGRFGQAEVFSLHATKFVNSLEGGVITTQDEALAERLRLMRNFGLVDHDHVAEIGINAKMHEISAAVGRTSLRHAAEFIAHNRKNYYAWQRALASVPGLTLLPLPEGSNFQYVVVEVNPSEFGLSRDQLMQLLHAEQLIARRYFYPGCHRAWPYCELEPEVGQRLPVTELLAQTVLVMPTGTAVSEEDIRLAGELLAWIHRQAEFLRSRL